MLITLLPELRVGSSPEWFVSLAHGKSRLADALANLLSTEPPLQVWQAISPAQWALLNVASGLEPTPAAVSEAVAQPCAADPAVSGRDLRLRRVNRQEVTSIPVRLEALLASDHPARLLWQVVAQFDLTLFAAQLTVVADGPGRPAIDPLILVALWLYASQEGVDSARDLARRCVENLPYIWLCGGVSVNYHTLSDFRVEHAAALDELMTRLLHQLDEAGLVNWENQAQDGLRVRASAGAASFRRQPTLEKRLAEAQAARAVQETSVSPARDPLSPRSQAAQERAAREKVTRLEAALAEMPAARAAKPAAEQEQARVSTTDALARVMKMADGGYRPAYNWQFAVETRHLIITGVDVVNTGSDKGQLWPMLGQVKTRCQRLPANWLVDGGFVNLTAFGLADQQGVCIYAPVPLPRAEDRDRFAPLPTDSTPVAAWRQRMATAVAKTLYKQRAASVECVNAQSRAQRGVQQVRVRGQAKVKCIALWTAITHNLLIWLRHLRQTLTPSPLVTQRAV